MFRVAEKHSDYGPFFLWFIRRQKTGKIIACLGMVVLFLVGCGAVSDMLSVSLESKYAPVTNVSALTNVKLIVVLGGGMSSEPELPITDQLSAESLIHLIEGMHL